MAYETCPDCGSRIYSHGCINCNERDYISMQEEYEPAALPTPSEGAVERKEEGRKDDTLYTYYQIELKNISEEWDYTICESLDEVLNTLKYLDHHLDDDTPVEPGQERQVIITGVGLTPIAYQQYKDECKKF